MKPPVGCVRDWLHNTLTEKPYKYLYPTSTLEIDAPLNVTARCARSATRIKFWPFLGQSVPGFGKMLLRLGAIRYGAKAQLTFPSGVVSPFSFACPALPLPISSSASARFGCRNHGDFEIDLV